MIDESKTGELDSVPSSKFSQVVEACTLCDICYINKCPYTPPHGFNIDFPRLMLRHRAISDRDSKRRAIKLDQKCRQQNSNSANGESCKVNQKTLSSNDDFVRVSKVTGNKLESNGGSVGFGSVHVEQGVDRRLSIENETFIHSLYSNVDLVSKLSIAFGSLFNFLTSRDNKFFRLVLEKFANIDRNANLPSYVPYSKRLTKSSVPEINKDSKVCKRAIDNASYAKKVIVFASCISNSNRPQIGNSALSVLSHNGIEAKILYEECCGMPQLESGHLNNVSERAIRIVTKLRPYIDEGYSVIPLVASCVLMFKKEWPSLLPNDENIKFLSENTFDISEYLLNLDKEQLLQDIPPLDVSVTLHNACHSRAQNIGFQAQKLLNLIPSIEIISVERCSGHGGTFGVDKKTHSVANKVGRVTFSKTFNNINQTKKDLHFIASDCPLSVTHIVDGVKDMAEKKNQAIREEKLISVHPIEILAIAYGFK